MTTGKGISAIIMRCPFVKAIPIPPTRNIRAKFIIRSKEKRRFSELARSASISFRSDSTTSALSSTSPIGAPRKPSQRTVIIASHKSVTNVTETWFSPKLSPSGELEDVMSSKSAWSHLPSESRPGGAGAAAPPVRSDDNCAQALDHPPVKCETRAGRLVRRERQGCSEIQSLAGVWLRADKSILTGVILRPR